MVTPKPRSGSVQVKSYEDGCCGIFFLKYVLYIFNVILLVSGLGITAVGVLAFLVSYRYVSLIGGHFDPLIICTYLLLGTGAVIILLAFTMGCCATCRRSRPCLMMYSVLLLLIFLLEAGTGILAYIYEMNIREALVMKLHSSVLQKYSQDKQIESAIDSLQSYFKCCGEKSFEDWRDSAWYTSPANHYNGTVPDSCCKTLTEGCGVNQHPSNINTEGCVYSYEALIRIQLIVIGGVGLGLCILQIFGMIFACCMAKRVQRRAGTWNGQNGY